MTSLLGVLLGLALLIVGGGFLVRGASQIAESLGVSPMVVGLTIVGFGTSAPELVVNVVGSLRGETGMAFGNVVGSNISNLSLVLGCAAIFRALTIHGSLVLREIPLLLLATAVITAMALDGALDGTQSFLSRSDAVVLLLLFGVFLYITALDFLRSRESDSLFDEVSESALVASGQSGGFAWLQTLGGSAMLFFGGQVTIDNGVALAQSLAINPTIIGLFVVAVGTSMPELATSAIAAMRGESDLALGNVVGSNIFNSLLVLPISALIMPISIPDGGLTDLLLSLALVAILIPIFLLRQARLGRLAGFALLFVYAAYAAARLSLA